MVILLCCLSCRLRDNDETWKDERGASRKNHGLWRRVSLTNGCFQWNAEHRDKNSKCGHVELRALVFNDDYEPPWYTVHSHTHTSECDRTQRNMIKYMRSPSLHTALSTHYTLFQALSLRARSASNALSCLFYHKMCNNIISSDKNVLPSGFFAVNCDNISFKYHINARNVCHKRWRCGSVALDDAIGVQGNNEPHSSLRLPIFTFIIIIMALTANWQITFNFIGATMHCIHVTAPLASRISAHCQRACVSASAHILLLCFRFSFRHRFEWIIFASVCFCR